MMCFASVLRLLRFWGCLTLLGLLHGIYALAILYSVFGTNWGTGLEVLPECASIAFGLMTMFFWWLCVLRSHRITFRRGMLVGLLSSFFAHPLMWYLLFLWSFITTGESFIRHTSPDPLTGLWVALAMFLIQAVVVWWIVLGTLVFGAIAGAGSVGILLVIQRVIRIFRRHTLQRTVVHT